MAITDELAGGVASSIRVGQDLRLAEWEWLEHLQSGVNVTYTLAQDPGAPSVSRQYGRQPATLASTPAPQSRPAPPGCSMAGRRCIPSEPRAIEIAERPMPTPRDVTPSSGRLSPARTNRHLVPRQQLRPDVSAR